MKKPNIIWIVVDCVRNYKSGTDDRDKLDIMYDLEREFVSFSKMTVSAPSSIMSAVNFLTGIPAYYLAGNYKQFQFDNDNFWSIRDILKGYGYSHAAVLNARECRTMLTDLLEPVPKKYLTRNVRPTMMRWPNSEVTDVYFNYLEDSPKEPFFHLLWYNTRLDPNMSKEIERLLQGIKDRGLYEDSIIILTADHGYPDRSRGLVSDGWDLWKAGLRHDILLTNDNIQVPFLIKYPGSTPKKIDQLVSTEDIVPTLLDLVNCKLPFQKRIPIFGESLVPLISGKNVEFFDNRIIRSDARFALQNDRNTSLQNRNHHLIVRHLDLDVEFYDTELDPGEINDVSTDDKNADVIGDLLDYFHTENGKIQKLQSEAAFEAFSRSISKLNLEAERFGLLIYNDSHLFETLSRSLISEIGKNTQLDLIVNEELHQKVSDLQTSFRLLLTDQTKDKRFDCVVHVVDDPASANYAKFYAEYKNVSGRRYFIASWRGDLKEIRVPFLYSPKGIQLTENLVKIKDKLLLGIFEPRYFGNEVKRILRKWIN